MVRSLSEPRQRCGIILWDTLAFEECLCERELGPHVPLDRPMLELFDRGIRKLLRTNNACPNPQEQQYEYEEPAHITPLTNDGAQVFLPS